MSEHEYDEIIVCPTCGYIERADEGREDQHLQPCPGERCGFALMLVRIDVWDEGQRELTIRWDAGEGAQLYMHDASKALAQVNDFLEDEEERIDTALDAIRRERQQQEDN